MTGTIREARVLLCIKRKLVSKRKKLIDNFGASSKSEREEIIQDINDFSLFTTVK